MVALTTALGGFHVPQQGIHFRDSQLPIGSHRAVTCHGTKQFVGHRLHTVAFTVLNQIRQHVPHQLLGVRTPQDSRHLSHGEGFRTDALDPQPQLQKLITASLCQCCLFLTDRKSVV